MRCFYYYTVRIRVTDQGGLWYEKDFTIAIYNINENPTDLLLSTNSITENIAGNTAVAALSTIDPDTDNTFTYTLVAGVGSTDNASFIIDGSSLRIKNSPDYETKSSYSIRIRTTDQSGLWFEKDFIIMIIDANDAPVITSAAGTSFAENGTGAVYTATGTDQEGIAITWSISGSDATLFTINSTTGVIEFIEIPNFEAPIDNDHDNVYNLTLTATDNADLAVTKDIAITVTNINEAPVISTSDTLSVVEGTTEAFTAVGSDPEGSAITWSITGGADAAKFSIVAGTGVATFVTAPSFSTPTDEDTNNSYVLELRANDGTLTSAKTVTVKVTQKSGGGGGGGGTATGTAAVEVNGKKQDAGTAATTTTGGQTVTTIKVDDTKLNTILENSGAKPTVTLPANTNPDVVVGELNGQTVKNMEAKEAVLEIKTGTVSYTLPASQINIDSVSSQLGSQVELKDIKVNVKIAEPPADTVKIIEDTASKGNYQLVVKPVAFEISCTSGDKTIKVTSFNGYVERTVAIPDGVEPNRITTGIVLNNDGSFRHVPTTIVQINGKYYAKINSLTNSTYSVIYNPVNFADVENHWAKTSINDMGSRMVVTGTGTGNYEPGRSITRAEFAAIVVRALGLQKSTAESAFGDVTVTDWFNGYVGTAAAYGLITGYDSKSFAPNDTITREQAMTILARAMKLTGLKVSLTDSEASSLIANYTDAGLVSDFAKAGVTACIRTGVVLGTSATSVSPKDYVTRAEVAVMAQRLLQKSGLI